MLVRGRCSICMAIILLRRCLPIRTDSAGNGLADKVRLPTRPTPMAQRSGWNPTREENRSDRAGSRPNPIRPRLGAGAAAKALERISRDEFPYRVILIGPTR